jgi:hypothetical protein
MARDSQGETSEVRIARISAKQAIIVATITALAGVVGSIISYSQGARRSPAAQHYLKIVRVEKRGFPNMHPSVRIVADINDQPYSYPSRAVWTDISDEEPGESFPLLTNQSEYVLRFSAFYRRDDGEVQQLTSSEVVRLAASQLPMMNTFSLYLLDKGFSRGGPDGIVIHFEVR